MARTGYGLMLIVSCLAFYFIGRYGLYGLVPAGAEAAPAETETNIYKVTAYCAGPCCCGKFADGITASGHRIKAGDTFVAAPKSMPFGTMLIVPGYNGGQAVPVLDRGGAIKGKRLDVYFPSHRQALEWGVKYLAVKKVGRTYVQ